MVAHSVHGATLPPVQEGSYNLHAASHPPGESMDPLSVTDDESRLIACFKALSNPIRYRMVRYMVENPQCITGDIVAFSDLAQSTVSQHLKVLRDSGLVCGTITGPATSYCLNPAMVRWFTRQVDALMDEWTACCAVSDEAAASHPLRQEESCL